MIFQARSTYIVLLQCFDSQPQTSFAHIPWHIYMERIISLITLNLIKSTLIRRDLE